MTFQWLLGCFNLLPGDRQSKKRRSIDIEKDEAKVGDEKRLGPIAWIEQRWPGHSMYP